jgi:transcriptional regulator with XRE-family HTH domain
MDHLVSAVRELRSVVGDTQDAFARRAGLSLRAIANYEKDRPPTAKALVQFARVASQAGRSDLAEIFSQAFQSQVGDASVDVSDELQQAALTALMSNRGPDWLQKELKALIREARNGKPLGYPLVFHGDRVPNHDMRIEYLEGLLIQLRMRGAESAETVLEDMAKERAARTGETKEKAYLEILMQSPDLYRRYNQERADAAKGTSLAVPLSVHGTRQQANRERKQKRAKK